MDCEIHIVNLFKNIKNGMKFEMKWKIQGYEGWGRNWVKIEYGKWNMDEVQDGLKWWRSE